MKANPDGVARATCLALLVRDFTFDSDQLPSSLAENELQNVGKIEMASQVLPLGQIFVIVHRAVLTCRRAYRQMCRFENMGYHER